MELTRKEIARIIATHWGCPVSEWHLGKEYPFDTPFVDADVMDRVDNVEADVKLKLRLLSAITDEDAIEVAKMWPNNIIGQEYTPGTGRAIVHYLTYPNAPSIVFYGYCAFQAIQFLIQRGYAIPLFIAPGHPLNGKTAIELGLAIPIE